tara:strand:+ start:191 stop:457 length:267 start_codon:yes stop_codon:yes gene_type:complete
MLQAIPKPGLHLDGVGEIFAARKADPTTRDDSHLFIVVFKADGQYHAATYNRCNGLHHKASYPLCEDAFSDYQTRHLASPEWLQAVTS